MPTFQDAADEALHILRPGDVFFTLGAGDIDQVGPMVLAGLREREKSRAGGVDAR
jgi:UDP-N-acetylmuramate-alanine ligase